MTPMVQPTTTRQNLHVDARIRHISTPLTCVNSDFVPSLHTVMSDAQHIALYATIWKYLKNEECKLQWANRLYTGDEKI